MAHDEDSKKYIEWIKTFNEWYTLSSGRWYQLLILCRVLMVVSSVAATTVSAFVNATQFEQWGKALIVGSSLLSALSYSIMSQFRVREMEELREVGRIEAASIYAYAYDKFLEYADDAKKLFALKDEIRDRLHQLETSQSRSFVDIFSARGDDPVKILKDSDKHENLK